MKVTNNRKYIFGGLVALILSAPMMASAAIDSRPESAQSMTLNVSDLDLTQDEGIETLYARLKSNVDKVCGVKHTHITGSRISSSKIERHFKKCTADSLNRAVQSINIEKLNNLHQQSTS